MKRKLITFFIMAVVLSITACKTESTQEDSSTNIALEVESEDANLSASTETSSEISSIDLSETSPELLFDGSTVSPDINLSDCDTMTQVVDSKLENGMAYTNATIGDTDVLLVASGCYDNLDGNMAAIDATIFAYDHSAIKEVGKVASGGTAYPLCLKNGNLFCASNAWIAEITIKNGEMILLAESWVEYGIKDNGEDAYYHYDATAESCNEIDESEFLSIYDQLADAEILNFDEVKK